MKNIVRYTSTIIISLLLMAVVTLSYKIITLSEIHQVRKYDNANINHMKYGLFNINIWKEKLTHILLSEVKEFKITSSNKKLLKKHAEEQLNVLIDKVDEHIRKSNKESTIGWLRQQFMDAFISVDNIKDGVPTYAEAMVEELTKNESQKDFKELLRDKIDNYVDKTFVKQDTSEVDSIVKRANVKNKKEAITYLAKEVTKHNKNLKDLTWILMALSAAVFLFVRRRKNNRITPFAFFACLGVLISLLVAGVLCPMIDMDAEISSFSFSLLGHPIAFKHQGVYFQSKSILDVFFVLMEDPDIQMKLVGVAMILFSIFFPMFKMISAIFYYFNIKGAKDNKIIHFFVLKSGKWSMADVQIVAILMAFIGFNGMVTSQFHTLRATIPQFAFISTNGTVLQIGFYLFLSYVILALVFSSIIEESPVSKSNNFKT